MSVPSIRITRRPDGDYDFAFLAEAKLKKFAMPCAKKAAIELVRMAKRDLIAEFTERLQILEAIDPAAFVEAAPDKKK